MIHFSTADKTPNQSMQRFLITLDLMPKYESKKGKVNAIYKETYS